MSGDRPPELQDWLNLRVFHPLARRLALNLATTAATPNMVSIAGAMCIGSAAILYVWPTWPGAVLIGFLCHLSWHVLDGADGDLARLTARASPVGELIDGVCDYAGHIFLYILLGFSLAEAIGGAAASLAVIAAGGSRCVQANHFETQRNQFQYWLYGKPWMRQRAAKTAGGILGAFTAYYLWLSSLALPHMNAIDRAVEAEAGAPGDAARVRRVIYEYCLPLQPLLKMLNANVRTVALGISMLAGTPLWFFIFEALCLNLVLITSIATHRRAHRHIVELIAEPARSRR